MKENLIPLASEVKNKDDISNSSEIDCSLGMDDLTSGNENDAIDSVELCAMRKELFENDTEFYTDKNVTECELPELRVCCNASTYNVIKDICVDDGAHSEKKILIKNVKDDLNELKSKSSSQESYEECGDNNKEGVNGLKSPSDRDFNRDAANECGNKDKVDLDLRTIGELKYSSGDDIDLNSSSESDSDQENGNTIDKSMDVVSSRDEFLLKSVPLADELRPQTSSKSILASSDCGCNDDGQHSCQISNEEAIPEHPAPIPAPEESNKSDRVNNVSCESKMESGTVTCDINSCKPTTITKNPGPKDVNEQPCKILNKDGMMDNLSVGNKVQREEGESSFCMAGPNSGIISYSGPISYSGSISLRSDSSTTSTRSFAFPVLQNEWNSSPIRMAKAERGYFRRHRRWKEGLLCCRF